MYHNPEVFQSHIEVETPGQRCWRYFINFVETYMDEFIATVLSVSWWGYIFYKVYYSFDKR